MNTINTGHKFFISFNLVIILMTSEYVIIGPRPWEAKIFLDHDQGEEIAEIKKGEDQKSFKLILVAIDGSESSLKAYQYASFVAKQCDAALLIVNIFDTFERI